VIPGNSWSGDGCANRFLYAAPDDPNYLQWLFTFDAPAARTCRIDVFVPDSSLASTKAWYGVADRFDNVRYRIGGFTVDQKANRGRWVQAATVPVDTRSLLVHVDGDQGLTGVTAGPLRVSCTGPVT
jgi:translation initiation factor IF-2